MYTQNIIYALTNCNSAIILRADLPNKSIGTIKRVTAPQKLILHTTLLPFRLQQSWYSATITHNKATKFFNAVNDAIASPTHERYSSTACVRATLGPHASAKLRRNASQQGPIQWIVWANVCYRRYNPIGDARRKNSGESRFFFSGTVVSAS